MSNKKKKNKNHNSNTVPTQNEISKTAIDKKPLNEELQNELSTENTNKIQEESLENIKEITENEISDVQDKKDKNSVKNQILPAEDSSTAVIQDIHDISDATNKAIQDIQKVTYSDNLKKPSHSSKTIRELNINENSTKSDDLVENDNPIYTPVKKKPKTWLIILLITIFIAILIGIFSTIFALINMNNNKILSGISIYGVDVSNLTKDEALAKLNSAFQEKLANAITFAHGEYQNPVFPEQLAVTFDWNTSINSAYEEGRNGNIFENNFQILNLMFNHKNIMPSFSFNDESFNALIADMNNNLPDKTINSSYYIDGNNLIITPGIDGVEIDSKTLKDSVLNYLNNLHTASNILEIPVISKVATQPDIEAIHNEIYKPAQDAYYTKNPYTVHPHVDGIDFAISVEEAKAMLANPAENYTIPLKVLSPKVRTSEIGTEAFPNLLGSYTTYYSTKNSNRSTNIALASKKINGTVVMPGETFSYNATVGKRTAAAGFKGAAAYVNGEVVDSIGGGICQVSSTLYNAVLLANLKIVERTNHGYDTGYVPVSRDATVSWGGPDFKFKNNRSYPIKIVCSGSGGSVSFKIFGLKSSDEYDVSIVSWVESSIPYKTVYKNTTSLAKGKQKVTQNGSNGCKSVAYRVYKKNGVEVSRELLSRDTYNPHNKVISVGI